MAKSPTFDTITAAFASASKLNANFAAVKTALENTVSLDGSTPNAMSGDFDLSGSDLINVGAVTFSTGSLTDAVTRGVIEEYVVDTRTAVLTKSIDTSVGSLRTSGYTTIGDGGDALYKRVGASEPSHGLKVQSSDGAWWEIIPELGVISPLQAGAVGDGSTNDATALNVVFDYGGTIRFTHGKTYAFSSQLIIHDDTEVIGTAKFKLDTSTTTTTAAIIVSANCEIERLELIINTSVVTRRPIVCSGAGTTIGFLSLISVDQQNNRGAIQDAGIKISGADVEINGIYVEKFDNGLWIGSTTGVVLGPIIINGYVRGMKIDNCSDIIVGQYRAHTASANASGSAGHNGILIEQSSQMQFDDIFIADAGEHGMRIGGDDGEIGCQYINFSSVFTFSSGQCGVKINDSSELTRGISFDSITAIDSATDGAPGSNEDGLRLEKCKDIHIGSLFVARKVESESAYDGIYLAGVTRIHIGSAYITDVKNHGVEIVDTVTGISGVTERPNESIMFGSLFIEGSAVDGINISHSAQDMGHIVVLDGYMRDISGDALKITTKSGSGSGGVPNPLSFTFRYHNVTGVALNTASTATRLFFNLTQVDSGTITIASGVITVGEPIHKVAVESGTTDDLVTINGGYNGKRVVLRADDSLNAVVILESGNIVTAGSFSLTHVQDTIELIYDSGLSKWLELSRSDNAA